MSMTDYRAGGLGAGAAAYAEDACPHADVAAAAGLRRRQSAGASGGDLRRLSVIAGLTGAGLLSGLPERRFFAMTQSPKV